MSRSSPRPAAATSGPRTAVVVCGALARDVHRLAERRGWEIDLFGVPAVHHLAPSKIVAAVEERLAELAPEYDRLVVVYGDCGTGGALDEVLERYGAVRLEGPHCYEMFGGGIFDGLVMEQPASYFLTDYLVRHWDTTVVPGMGLDRRPELKERFFAGFTRVVHLCQERDPGLEEKARRIACFLELPLEVREVGLGEFEARLARSLTRQGPDAAS